jgi:hypothetical protein
MPNCHVTRVLCVAQRQLIDCVGYPFRDSSRKSFFHPYYGGQFAHKLLHNTNAKNRLHNQHLTLPPDFVAVYWMTYAYKYVSLGAG